MKTDDEIELELARVRAALRRSRKAEEDDTLMYGAQQALTWVLGTGEAPSKVQRMIDKLASDPELMAMIEARDG